MGDDVEEAVEENALGEVAVETGLAEQQCCASAAAATWDHSMRLCLV